VGGNVYITGVSWPLNDTFRTRIHILKYSPSGQLLWHVFEDPPSFSMEASVTTDGSGNVYATWPLDEHHEWKIVKYTCLELATSGKSMLIENDNEDWYKIGAQEALKVKATITQTSGTNFDLYLYDGNLTEIDSETSDSLQTKTVEAPPATSNTWYIMVGKPVEAEADHYLLTIKIENQNDMGLFREAPNSLTNAEWDGRLNFKRSENITDTGWLLPPADSIDVYAYDVAKDQILTVSAALPPNDFGLEQFNTSKDWTGTWIEEEPKYRKIVEASGISYTEVFTGISLEGHTTPAGGSVGHYLLSIGVENQNDANSGSDAGDDAATALPLGEFTNGRIAFSGISGTREDFVDDRDVYKIRPLADEISIMKVVVDLNPNFDPVGTKLSLVDSSLGDSYEDSPDSPKDSCLKVLRPVIGGQDYYIDLVVDSFGMMHVVPYQMKIYLDSALPSVAITSPAAGETVPATAKITVDASDANGIENVEFYVDGKLEYTATAPTPTRVLLSDNFNDDDYSGWTVESGSWAVEGGELSSSGIGDENISAGSVNWGDVIIETRVKRISGEDYAIDFRWDDGSNHYRMQTWDDYNTLRLHKMYSGGYKQLAWADLTGIDPTTWHTWKIEANGPNIRLRVHVLLEHETGVGQSYRQSPHD
jgi:hypothetical protein